MENLFTTNARLKVQVKIMNEEQRIDEDVATTTLQLANLMDLQIVEGMTLPLPLRDDETNPTAEENELFVYYRYIASLEGRQSRLLRIYVNEGDNIDSITKRIKNMNHFFASVSAEQMEMYESIEQEDPLPSFNLRWELNVTWDFCQRLHGTRPSQPANEQHHKK